MDTQIQIERSILSAIFYDPERLDIIEELLSANDFYYIPHRNIFRAIQDLKSTDRTIDE
ncbi:MAG: DnaB-like helicase N-terminal domain-containing protein [Helicobacter sp.]|nr:DnaB-like helicase N-terminal domain-containing protein [Helicobacter sp.]